MPSCRKLCIPSLRKKEKGRWGATSSTRQVEQRNYAHAGCVFLRSRLCSNYGFGEAVVHQFRKVYARSKFASAFHDVLQARERILGHDRRLRPRVGCPIALRYNRERFNRRIGEEGLHCLSDLRIACSLHPKLRTVQRPHECFKSEAKRVLGRQ